MPEGPEVELARTSLLPLVGQRLVDAARHDDYLLPATAYVEGLIVCAIRRHGKLLSIQFDGGQSLFCHLRMTGILRIETTMEVRDDANPIRAILEFESSSVTFRDRRRLGSLEVRPSADFGKGYGVDLLDAADDELRAAARRCASRRRPAKSLMLDQRGPVAGAGNYLVDETLFACRVHPTTAANALSATEWEGLWAACRGFAQRSVAGRTARLEDFVAPAHARGDWPDHLVCYGRAGLPCTRCATTLVRISVGNRGGTLCPTCQRETPASYRSRRQA